MGNLFGIWIILSFSKNNQSDIIKTNMNEYLDYIKQGQKTELIIRTPGGAVRFFQYIWKTNGHKYNNFKTQKQASCI